jgi:hypothetical protein
MKALHWLKGDKVLRRSVVVWAICSLLLVVAWTAS